LYRALAMPVGSGAAQRDVAAGAPVPTAVLEEIVPRLVRRIAWGGDGRRGTARIELGSGALADATLLVETNGGDVRVELVVPAGVAVEPLRARLKARLEARGLRVGELVVR
jgi:hypothetical protein